jgi:hypothetical protein
LTWVEFFSLWSELRLKNRLREGKRVMNHKGHQKKLPTLPRLPKIAEIEQLKITADK